jgi:glycosyltransferase involved in cell wall biosynthesis
MMARAPLVSVTMPAYNNARHIAQAIESVLAQTTGDFELVIVDDGSSDGTAAIVRRFDDPRIVLLSQANRGAADATNTAIRAARGRYVALFAADDICRPGRLERELRHLDETGLRIVFSWADFIGDAGEPLSGEHFASRWFNHPSQTRAEMLARFFFHGNYLCTVSCLAERQLFVDAGLFPVTSAQLPDFAMWLALVKEHELGILPERLLEYRVHSDGSNVSTPANSRRAYFEMCQIYRGMFSGCPADLFRAAFAGRLGRPDFAEGHEYALEQSFLYLQHDIPAVRALGLERLYRQLQDPACLAVAERSYGFGLSRLLDLTNSFDATTAVEYLDMRQWAIGVDQERRSLWTERQALITERESVIADNEAVRADRDALRTGYEAVEAELRKTQAEFAKLEAYTRHVLAVKDEIQAELRRVVPAASPAGE